MTGSRQIHPSWLETGAEHRDPISGKCPTGHVWTDCRPCRGTHKWEKNKQTPNK